MKREAASTRPTGSLSLSTREARSLALRAQGFGDGRSSDPTRILDTLGAIQLDSVNVLARSHDLVPCARVGPNSIATMHEAIYQKRQGFEYWGHAASWLPMDEYRYFLPRMAAMRNRWASVGDAHAHLYAPTLERIRAEGALSVADFQDTRPSRGFWWNWKPAKLVLEHLFAQGDLMCAGRRAGFERLYDLPERVLPSSVDARDPGPAEAHRHLLRRAIAALGVATAHDAADYFRLSPADWRPALSPRTLLMVARCSPAACQRGRSGPRSSTRPRSPRLAGCRARDG